MPCLNTGNVDHFMFLVRTAPVCFETSVTNNGRGI